MLFWLVPRHWGLKGKDLAEARIRWEEADSYKAEREIVKLDYPQLFDDSVEKDDDEEFLEAEKKAYEADLLDVDLKWGKIKKKEYDRQIKNLEGEGWVDIINVIYDPKLAARASFELDYNDKFVEELREQGYPGATDEEVVSNWMDHLFFTSMTEGLDPEVANDIEATLKGHS